MIALMIIEIVSIIGIGALAGPFIGSYGNTVRTVEPMPISPSVFYSILLLVACLLPLIMEIILKGRQKKPSLVTGIASSIVRVALFLVAILMVFIVFMSGYEHLWGNFDFVFKFASLCACLSFSIASLLLVSLSLKKSKKTL